MTGGPQYGCSLMIGFRFAQIRGITGLMPMA